MTDQDLGAAARDWEGAICDLLSSTDIAAFIAEETLQSERGGVNLGESEVERIKFAVYQTHKMMSEFRDRYYEAIEIKR